MGPGQYPRSTTDDNDSTTRLKHFVEHLQRQQQQRPESNSFTRLQPAVPTELLAIIVDQFAAAHFEDPILPHLYNQPGRRVCVVRFYALLVASQLVRLAVNSLLAFRLPPSPLAPLLRPATALHFIAPTFCCPCPVSFFCASVTLRGANVVSSLRRIFEDHLGCINKFQRIVLSCEVTGVATLQSESFDINIGIHATCVWVVSTV